MIEIRKIEEVRRGVDIPEITGIYDPLSGRKGVCVACGVGGEGKMEKMRDNKRIYHDRYIVTQSFLIYGIKYYMSL